MSVSCISKICCDDDLANCFVELCDNKYAFDSAIVAIGIAEGDSLPAIGSTIDIDGVPTVITECNYIDILEKWFRVKQYECSGGAFYHFMHKGFLKKGTRAKPTQTFDENTASYSAPTHQGYETTIEAFLGSNFLPNSDVFCGIMKRGLELNVVLFFKQGGLVLDSSNGHMTYISDAGFEVTGNYKEKIQGSFVITESGDCQPKPYYTQDPVAFIKKLSKKTEFTFDDTVLTVIAPASCIKKGDCFAYDVAANTSFEMQFIAKELLTCGIWKLFQNCNEEVDVALDIAIDTDLGLLTSAGGLPVGDYKFTVQVANDCCVSGTNCFYIKVR